MAGRAIGHLNRLGAQFGTILGPTWTREWVVVLEPVGPTAIVGYATPADIEAARVYVAEHGPRSVTEHRLFGGQR